MRRAPIILLSVAAVGAALLAGTTAAQPAAARTPCVVTGKNGTCGPYRTKNITLSNGHNTYVLNNKWNCGANAFHCGRQKLTAYNPSKWWVRSNQAAGNTAVLTYPDVMQIFTRPNGTGRAVRHFASIRSYYAELMPHNARTNAEAAYDVWLDHTTGSDEVMIWVDQVNRGTGGARRLLHHTFFHRRYTLLRYGGPGGVLTWAPRRNDRRGTVHILPMLRWLMRHHYESGTSGIVRVDFGWEICSTGGVPESFKLTAYNLKTRRL